MSKDQGKIDFSIHDPFKMICLQITSRLTIYNTWILLVTLPLYVHWFLLCCSVVLILTTAGVHCELPGVSVDFVAGLPATAGVWQLHLFLTLTFIPVPIYL